MSLGKKSNVILSIILTILPSTTFARSVYVISDTGDSNLAAYRIEGTSLIAQPLNYICQADGAVGLALDPDSATMLVTYEGCKRVIDSINAEIAQMQE
ncbi:MAG: hypothetical protein AMJ43_10000 [Coxiella sp. DG_40]|nr:MAG: hypothetical protein AMJ43_10000 [Coxiella sp. DG_40]